jgi:hypothetical protein
MICTTSSTATSERARSASGSVRDRTPEVAARFAGFSPASLYRYLRGSTPEHAAFRDAALKAQVDLEVRLSGTLVQEAMSGPRSSREAVRGAVGSPSPRR